MIKSWRQGFLSDKKPWQARMEIAVPLDSSWKPRLSLRCAWEPRKAGPDLRSILIQRMRPALRRVSQLNVISSAMRLINKIQLKNQSTLESYFP